MKRTALLFIAGIFVLFAGQTSAQQTEQSYVVETRYLLYLPDGYDPGRDESWPLVVFLHGAGEIGGDIEKIKVHGLPKLVEQGMSFPFIGVSPQVESYGWDPKTVHGLIRDVMSKYSVDADRIYLTGISMGGFGTWATAQAYPGLFAAIVPVCGGGDTSKAYTLANTPVWNFHGDADSIVSVRYSDDMVEAVSEFNPSIKYTVYPGVDHDSWTQTYDNPEVWEWMLAQRRFVYEEVTLEADVLNEYAGDYFFAEDRDNELSVEIDGSSIVLSISGYREVNHPAGNDVFFVYPDSFFHTVFERDGSGEITGFTSYHPNRATKFIRKK